MLVGIVCLVVVGSDSCDDTGELLDHDDDQRGERVVPTGRRWWSKEGAWQGEEFTKEARRPFTKCSSPRKPRLNLLEEPTF